MLGIGLAPQKPRRMSLVEVIHSLEPDFFWPLWERSGVVAADIIGGNDGSADCGWGGKGKCFPFATLDRASTQKIGLPQAALDAAFNPQEGYMLAWGWLKAAAWVAALFHALFHVGEDTPNRGLFYHSSGIDDIFTLYFNKSNTAYQRQWDSGGSEDVFGAVMSWSETQNVIRVAVNGAQIGSDAAYGPAYVGGVNTYHDIGATSGTSDTWDGGAGMIALGSRLLSVEECKRVTTY